MRKVKKTVSSPRTAPDFHSVNISSLLGVEGGGERSSSALLTCWSRAAANCNHLLMRLNSAWTLPPSLSLSLSLSTPLCLSLRHSVSSSSFLLNLLLPQFVNLFLSSLSLVSLSLSVLLQSSCYVLPSQVTLRLVFWTFLMRRENNSYCSGSQFELTAGDYSQCADGVESLVCGRKSVFVASVVTLLTQRGTENV